MSEDTLAIPEVNIDVAVEREKPRLVSLLFFDYANRTGNNKLNLIGAFDRIYINPEIKRTPPIGVFVRTGRTYDGEVILTVFNPKGEMVAALAFKSDIAVEMRSFQLDGLFRIEFETSVGGVYWFDVSYRGKSIGGAGLLVELKRVKETEYEHTSGDA